MPPQQALIASGFGGTPQNITGGVNLSFNPDGTCSVTTGAIGTPANWMSIAPQGGIGTAYWILFGFNATTSGTATAITNGGTWLELSTARLALCNGVGAANYNWFIAASSGGATLASGVSNANNTI